MPPETPAPSPTRVKGVVVNPPGPAPIRVPNIPSTPNSTGGVPDPETPAIRSFLGASGVELGLLQTGITQTEILHILTEIARDDEATHSDRMSACRHIQRTVERTAELSGLIGKTTAEQTSEGEGGRLVRRVEVSRIIPPAASDDRSFLSFEARSEPIRDPGTPPPAITEGTDEAEGAEEDGQDPDPGNEGTGTPSDPSSDD